MHRKAFGWRLAIAMRHNILQSCGLGIRLARPSTSRDFTAGIGALWVLQLPIGSEVPLDRAENLSLRDRAQHTLWYTPTKSFDRQARAITSVAEHLSTPCVTPGPSLIMR